jgi:hypothetical protein
VQPLEILKIAIEKWIFVIPFNFQCDGSIRKRAHVIDFVGLCFAFDAVDNSLHNKFMLAPVLGGQCITESLSPLCLSKPSTRNWSKKFKVLRAKKSELQGFWMPYFVTGQAVSMPWTHIVWTKLNLRPMHWSKFARYFLTPK